jgi:D-alanyl-D-alanine dipeptidase
MRKSTAVLLGILGVLVVFYLIGSRRQETASAPATTTAASSAVASWHQIAEWSGSGIKQTEGFRPDSREVRISWDSRPANAALTIFQLYLHRASDDLPVEVAANTAETGEGSTLVRLQPGQEYYLKVNAAGKWAVKVEDRR